MMKTRRSIILCRVLTLCVVLCGNFVVRAQWAHKMIGPTSLAFSPDGRWVAAGSIEDWVSPGDLRVWETKSGKLIHQERYVYGVQALAFAPDGKTLAVATSVSEANDAIRLWNVNSWRVERTTGGRQYIYSLAFSPDGKRIVAGSNMGENGETEDTYLWNLPQRISRALPRSNGLSQMLFSSRNDFLIGAFYSGYYNDDRENLRAWDATGRFLWHRPLPGLSDIALTPEGRTFMVAVGRREDGKKHDFGLQIRELATGRLLQKVPQSTAVSALAIAFDGKTWASGDIDGKVRLWNAKTRRVVKTLHLHKDSIGALKFSPDGRFLASIGGDNLVRLTALH